MRNPQLSKVIPQLEETLGRKIIYDEDAILHTMQSIRKSEAPLYIKVLSVLGGIFGALALLGFLILAGLYESEIAVLVLGALCIPASILINKSFDSLLPDTASVAIYLIGYSLLIYGLDALNMGENLISLLVIAAALATLINSNSLMLVFISILIVSGGLLSFAFINEAFGIIHGHVALLSVLLTGYFLKEPGLMRDFPRLVKFRSAVRSGLIFSLIMGLLVVGIRDISPLPYQYLWISSVFTILCTVAVLLDVLKLFKKLNTRHKILLCVGCVVVLIPTSFSPAISGSLLLILLNYKVSYRTGLFIGIISLVYFVCQFYYDLNLTLLNKAILMFTSGLIFIIFYYLLHKFTGNEEI